MNHLIEQLVKDYRHHMHALESFGSLAMEVYIAYLLEKVAEHFHETIGKFSELHVVPRVTAPIKRILTNLASFGRKFLH